MQQTMDTVVTDPERTCLQACQTDGLLTSARVLYSFGSV